MKNLKQYLSVAFLVSGSMMPVAAQDIVGFIKKVGSTIDSMAVRGVDHRYIESPAKPWQIIVKGNVNQSIVSMHTNGSIAGFDYVAKPYLKTEPSQYLGLWAGYRGYGFGYTANVGGDNGIYYTFGATGGSYGVNVRIHRFENDYPDFNLHSDLIPEESEDAWEQVKLIDPIRMHTVIADGYYLFNGKHFSYAAAYDQSVIQRRSAGSLLAGAMYYYGSIKYASNYNADLIYVMSGLGSVKLWQGSVGIGYAYNWVPVRGLLVNVMAMPMLTFVNKIKVYGYSTNIEELMLEPEFMGENMSDEEWDQWFYERARIEPMGSKLFNSGMRINFDARFSVTYNFSNWFINAYGQFNNFRYKHKASYGHMNDWFINASIGLRL